MELKNGLLTVKANNSDLSQIVKGIADASGMVVDGSIQSARVYGAYGPSDPRDLLTELLTGSGYNFMMVGVGQQGAPRELLLTPEQRGSSPPAANPPGEASKERAPATTTPAQPAESVPDQEELGPGAIEHAPPPPADNTEDRVQQNLQRLQQMQDKQNQPNPPQ